MIKVMKPNLYEEAAELLFHEMCDGGYRDLAKSLQRFAHHEDASALLDACLEMEDACKDLTLRDDLLSLNLGEHASLGELLWRSYYSFFDSPEETPWESPVPPSEFFLERFRKDRGTDFLISCLYQPDDAVKNYDFEEMQHQLLNSDLDAEIKCQLLKICFEPEPAVTALCTMVEQIADRIKPILEKHGSLFDIAGDFLAHADMEALHKKIPLKVDSTRNAYLLPLLTGLNKAWVSDLTPGKGIVLGGGLLFFVLDVFSPRQTLQPQSLSQHLKCFADETKLNILLALGQNDTYQAALAKQLGLTPATISHHLDYLASHGVISYDVNEKKIYYRLEREWVDFLADELKRIFGTGTSHPGS